MTQNSTEENVVESDAKRTDLETGASKESNPGIRGRKWLYGRVRDFSILQKSLLTLLLAFLLVSLIILPRILDARAIGASFELVQVRKGWREKDTYSPDFEFRNVGLSRARDVVVQVTLKFYDDESQEWVRDVDFLSPEGGSMGGIFATGDEDEVVGFVFDFSCSYGTRYDYLAVVHWHAGCQTFSGLFVLERN